MHLWARPHQRVIPMPTIARGAAYVDRSGTVLAADAGFGAELGFASADATAGLRALAESHPGLRAILSGDGTTRATVGGASGDVEVEAVATDGGLLLVVGPARGGEWLEHAMRSQGLGRIAAGLAHDIKNPLNAMALQLALLTEKLASAGEAGAGGHLAALRDQIGRVNEVVRRFLDVTDPSAPLGYIDLGALAADAVALFGHEARRRRLAVAVDAGPGAVRTRADPARLGRLVLGILSRAAAETPDGGRVAVRAVADGGRAVLRVEHAIGDRDPETGYYSDVAAAAAAALGGSLSVERDADVERLFLRLPGNGHE